MNYNACTGIVVDVQVPVPVSQDGMKDDEDEWGS